MPHQFFIDRRPHNGLSYEIYFEMLKSKVENPDKYQSGDQENNYEQIKLNYHRSNRINKSYNVNKKLCAEIAKIEKPQIWMILTEDWCGDSAQTIPYIAKFAACNPLINLKLLLRDDNLDIIDLYLTNGKSRAIPKLVAFYSDGNELFQWGPRPNEGVRLVENAKSEGKSKDQFIEELHLWYGRNRGKAIEEEFLNIFESVLNYSDN